MYKKVLLLLVGADVLTRSLAMAIYFISGAQNLPLPVLAISGIIAVAGIILVAKFLTKGVSLQEISMYLALDFIGILSNLIYSRVISLVESTKIIDTLIIGNLLLLPLCPILIYCSIRKGRYISIPSKVIDATNEAEKSEDEAPIADSDSEEKPDETETKAEKPLDNAPAVKEISQAQPKDEVVPDKAEEKQSTPKKKSHKNQKNN